MTLKEQDKILKTMKKLILIIFAVVLISCGNPVKRNNEDKSIQDFGYLKVIGDSLEIPFFEIELTLSEKAEEKLKAYNESVIIVATFESEVNEDSIPEKFKNRVDVGRLTLLLHRIELTDKRLARFENLKFHKDLYDLLENQDIELLINVVSGRRSVGINILSCDILDGSMSKIKEKRFTINGKLIGEESGDEWIEERIRKHNSYLDTL